MQRTNKVCLTTADGSTKNGDTLDSNQWVRASFQAYTAGTGDGGTVKIQGSNDPSPGLTPGAANPAFTPTHWSDIPNATITVASGVGPILMIECSYRWMRAVYTKSSGTDALNVQVFAISP